MKDLNMKRVYIGSWFQRTTLHLSEVYDFFTIAKSPLDFDAKKLKKLRDNLNLATVEDIHSDFEYIKAVTKDGILLKIYEDGLITLSRNTDGDIKETIKRITSYYEKELSAGLKYIFSLGAPIPKELANIKTVYPYFVVFENAQEDDIHNFIDTFGQEEHFEIKRETFDVYRGDFLYVINLKGELPETIERFIEETIFIREFKGQMHRYLNLHRIIWENIAEVKEKGSIKGNDVAEFKDRIEGYEKSINMIDTRINQMGAYISTRGAIVKNDPEMKKFIDILQFKYDTLSNTLSYVKEIWKMTKTYVSSALNVFTDLQAKATNNSIKNLTVVTSMGVGGTLLGLFGKESLPNLSITGVYYFFYSRRYRMDG